MTRILLGPVLALLPMTALAGQIRVASATASSTYPTEEGVSYDARRATDGKASTAWVEGSSGSGLGDWIELDLGGDHTVHSIRVWAGMWYSTSFWSGSARPRELEVKLSDGSTHDFTLADSMEPQEFVLPSPTATSTVRLRIKQVYRGDTWNDAAISEVQVYDDAPDTRIPVRAIEASSTATADADGTYEPGRVDDRLSDTFWCEGNTADADAGNGTGEWLQFDLGGTRSVRELHLVNGMATSLPFFMKGNRATAATLSFSDGSTEHITIKNTMMPQTIGFAPHRTDSIRVTFDQISAGREFNDLCVSEAYFAE